MDQLIEITFEALLDTKLSIPLYQQLHSKLREAILKGVLPAGNRLPATRAMARRHNISRNTVLTAYEQLIAEGYLETQTGAGTFVCATLPDSLIMTTSPQPVPTQHKKEHTKSKDHLTPGSPAINQFPKSVWARLVSRAWRNANNSLLTHDDPQGYAPLRVAIAKYLHASRGVVATADQVLIVAGLQQGLKLIIDGLMEKPSTVMLEEPGYPGMYKTARMSQAKIIPVPIDENGATVPNQHDHNKHPSNLLVISPSRQYPLGLTMPISRRLELLAWAQETNSLILEDDYDSEFRYAGKPLTALQGIDGGDRVIYGGSFSKSVFPALRLGYLIMPPALVEPITRYRSAVDSFPSIMPQLALTSFIEEGHFARHIRQLHKTHAHRQALFCSAFNKHLSHWFDLTYADTGLHLMAVAKNDYQFDDITMAKHAKHCGLAASPLSITYHSTKSKHGLLFGFANIEEQKIDSALQQFSGYMPKETHE